MRFNLFTKKSKTTVNYEGAKAFKLSSEMELYTAVVTTSLSTSFYENTDKRLDRIITLIEKCEPQFVAKLAVYTRTKMNLRTIPLVLVVELSKIHSGDNLISRTVLSVIQRADEITELLAYYQLANKRGGTKKLNRLSKQVQKGIAMAFNKFDEYQFAKYNRKTEIQLKDALFLTHPKAINTKQQLLFDKIVHDTLDTPYTWETELSSVGQGKFSNEEERSLAFKVKWEELVYSNKLGYMAMMRNLRNMIEADVDYSAIKKVCETLSSGIKVARSRQLPFRYLAAYREVKQLDSHLVVPVLDALEDAILESASNIKGFDSKTKVLIACDVSGSMQKPISERSKILLYDIGLVLGMLLKSQSASVVTGMFGDRWKIINMPSKSILSNVQEYYRREGEVGYATNGYLVIQDLIDKSIAMDKVMLFTDTQMWNNSYGNASFERLWKQYKNTIAPNASLYIFDLAGYGNVPIQVEKNNVYLIAGWSDKIFDILSAIDNGSNAIAEIQRTEL